MRILLVEDDTLLGDGLKEGLNQNGYTTDWVKNATAARHAILNESFDVIILDLGLPGSYSGLDLLRNIRKKNILVPVLILTAKETIEDRVEGLDSGADDYMVKPVDLEELCARIRALMRRGTDRLDPLLRHGNLILDPAAHTVSINGENIHISRREFALLHKFLENPGRVISRDQLAQALYGWHQDVHSNALEVHIHNLRRKVKKSLHIRTIRGVGYIIENDKNNARYSSFESH